MSDSLASERTLERPSDNGQVERASEAQPQGSTGGSASTNGQPTQDENIKNLQRKLSEKDLQTKQALQEAQRASALVQQMQQRLAQMEDASAPDDFTRMELKLKRAEEQAAQYASAYQQAIAEKQAEQERQSALREIADEFDVSVKDLEGATDYKSAVKLALKAQQDKEKRKQQHDNDKSERNMPDLGGGAPRTALSDWERQWQEAQANKNSAAMIRLDRTRPKAGSR